MGKQHISKKYRKKYSSFAKLLKLARQVDELSMIVRELDEDSESNAEDYADEFIAINKRIDNIEYAISEIVAILEKEGLVAFGDDIDKEDYDDDEESDA